MNVVGKLSSVANKFKIKPKDRYKTALISGSLFKIPLQDKFHDQHLDPYEDYFDDFINIAINMNKGVFVDIGVNVGQILLKLKSHQPNRLYVGFEASVPCCSYIYKLIDVNQIENCTIIPLGLSDKNSLVSFYYSSSVDPQATIIDNFWTDSNKRAYKRSIYVNKGDDVLRNIDAAEIGVVKIDVEGGELEVLRGLTDTIRRDRPIILTEVLPHLYNFELKDRSIMLRRKQRSEDLVELIQSLDYTCLRALPGRRVEEVSSFGADKFIATQTNYVFIPNEQRGDFDRNMSEKTTFSSRKINP